MSDKDRDRLLKNATDWVGEAEAAGSALAPFRGVPFPVEVKR